MEMGDNMSFNPRNITPSPNDWFSTNIEYEGQGHAEFRPTGAIEGTVKIRFDEFGESRVEMKVGKVETEFNPCIKLEVDTPLGKFTTLDEKIHYGYPLNDIFNDEMGAELNFYPIRSQFDVTGAGSAKYWVLPLLNFLSEFTYPPFTLHYPDLDHHPLRIYPTPIIPDGLTEEETKVAFVHANSKNHLIVFEFNDSQGFIEPLDDFGERKNKLYSKRERCMITAIMVGEVKSKSIDFDNLKQWFPFDFLSLLGMATGTEVGAPWIEFRDAQGKLVRRIHVNPGCQSFSRGHIVIKEHIHSGIGHLLTQCQFSQHYRQSYLHSIIKNLIQGGLYSLTIEDRLSHLFRAIDGLCEEYQLKNILSPNPNNKAKIDKVIKNATKAICNIAKQAENYASEAEMIRGIASQVAEAKNIRRGFGKAVVALLDKFSLPDASIIDAHYKMNPRPDKKKKWSDLLSYYRGITMHRSYFDFQGNKHDIEDAMRILNHLHDILVRIIFKILGYNGTYQPTIIKMATAMPVDWVKPDFPAIKLGYQ